MATFDTLRGKGLLKTVLEKDKMLVTSILSFSPFFSTLSQSINFKFLMYIFHLKMLSFGQGHHVQVH